VLGGDEPVLHTASVNSKLLQRESNPTRDHGATDNELRHQWVGAPSFRLLKMYAPDDGDGDKLLQVFASCNIRVRAVGVAQPNRRRRYGSISLALPSEISLAC
jgi:hypothetical protein